MKAVLNVRGRAGVQDHLLDNGQAVFGKKHVLGTAQANTLGAVLQGTCGVLRGVRVGPDTQPPGIVGPLEQRVKSLLVGETGGHRGQLTQEDLAGGTVDADLIQLPHDAPVDCTLLGLDVHRQCLAPGDAGFAQAPRDHGGVARSSSAGRKNASRSQHSVYVVRSRLRPDQYDALPRFTELHRPIGIEHRFAAGRAGRSVQPDSQEPPV